MQAYLAREVVLCRINLKRIGHNALKDKEPSTLHSARTIAAALKPADEVWF